ncbi:DUF4870 domain-containing protein [Natrialba taiwanensis]|uniref:DUF4870 domain-containing protein n=1 Tax=Natrialba taiwanensis TaxID=160846 RepID=UPI0009FBDBF1|nr:DUF4870 domain-containing protein [Natrialba taiwanensis]
MTANVTGRKSNSNQDTTIAALVHISGLFFGFFAIVFVYLVSDDEFAKANAANALNWHVPISLMAILVVIIGIGVSELAGVAIAIIIAMATICFALIASMKAYQGREWKYPIVPQII